MNNDQIGNTLGGCVSGGGEYYSDTLVGYGNMGWQCPRCNRCYSPQTSQCSWCPGNGFITYPGTFQPSVATGPYPYTTTTYGTSPSPQGTYTQTPADPSGQDEDKLP